MILRMHTGSKDYPQVVKASFYTILKIERENLKEFYSMLSQGQGERVIRVTSLVLPVKIKGNLHL